MYVSIIDIDDIPGMQHSYASKFRLGLKQSILQDYEKNQSQTSKTKLEPTNKQNKDRYKERKMER